jgi:hypothetical protein
LGHGNDRFHFLILIVIIIIIFLTNITNIDVGKTEKTSEDPQLRDLLGSGQDPTEESQCGGPFVLIVRPITQRLGHFDRRKRFPQFRFKCCQKRVGGSRGRIIVAVAVIGPTAGGGHG